MKRPPPQLMALALMAALADLAQKAEGADRPKCGHEVRADREAERADYLTRRLRSVQRQLRDLIARTQRVSEADLLPLVEAIDKDLAHADELTRPPQAEQAPQAEVGEQTMAATNAHVPDPLEDLPPELRAGILRTVRGLRALPLPPGASAELLITTRKDA